MKKILAFLLCAVMTLSVCVAAFPAHAADNCTDAKNENASNRECCKEILCTLS